MTPLITAYLAWLKSGDWRRWRALDPKGIQPRYKDWLEQAKRLEQGRQQEGIPVVRVAVDPEQFAAWCRQAGVEPDSRARANFAYEIGTRNQMH